MKTIALFSILLPILLFSWERPPLWQEEPWECNRLMAYADAIIYYGQNYRETPKEKFQLDRIFELEKRLKSKIHGQDKPIEATVQVLVRYASGLNDPEGPIGCLLFVGPTGVGKTELAKQLALELTGNRENLIRIDLSEYSEAHSVAKLIGSPPGYVGYDCGGHLIEAIRKKSNAIILLDEIDKAHHNVIQLFLQAFDEARITDAKGISVDCHGCLFLLTTNLAAKTILQLHATPNATYDSTLQSIQSELITRLSPELYNRLEPILFTPLSQDQYCEIARGMLDNLSERMQAKKNIDLSFDGSVVAYLLKKGYSYELGARPLKRLINNEIIAPLSNAIFRGQYHSGEALRVSCINGKCVID